ncbi:MAG TPA: hypothetical protein VF092_09925 [Longimicrobium sp.]
MQIDEDILQRHMEEAAIEQLAAEYLHKGYSVVPAPENGGGDADLVVRRGDERIYFHVRSTPDARQRLTRVHRHVNEQENARLQMVIVRPPKAADIDVEDFEARLLRLCTERIATLGFAGTGYVARPKRVTDVRFDTVNVKREGIEVQGTAVGEFDLDCGGSPALNDTFLLNFHLMLSHELEIASVESLTADVSGYVE